MAASRPTSDRIPSLDGLRAVSIMLVLVAHLGGTAGFVIPATLVRVFDVGNLGVRVFFVISGFLITGMLLREQEHTGTISIPHFYFRRTLRIFPAYYAYIAVVFVVWRLGWVALRPHDLLHALTYTENYNTDRAWVLGHTWSLSVEEQFYLVWPAVLLFAGTRQGMRVAATFVCVAPLVRLSLWYGAPPWYPYTGYTFESVGDAIATGCLLAGFRAQLWANHRYRALLSSRWFWIVPALVVAISSAERPRVQALIGITAMNVGVALCLDWAIRNADGAVGRVLNAAPLVLIGQMSYSLYIWQQPFLNRSSSAAFARFPINILMASTAALASYYLVEQPFLRVRKRIENWWRRPKVDATRTAGT